MKKSVILSSIVIFILLIIGMIYDLDIDIKFYNPESSFARIFDVIGIFPEFALLIFAPAMILAVLFVQQKNIFSLLIGVLILVLIIIVGYLSQSMLWLVSEKFKISFIFALSAFVLSIILCTILVFPFAKKKADAVFFVGVIGLLSVLIGETILELLKTFWGRQRFYTMDNPVEQFTAWYLPLGGGGENKFKSFPSGHSFAAMSAIWFTLWPRFIESLKKYTIVICTLAVIFAFTVMFSRIVYGRHFLSDVTAGASLYLASFIFVKYIIDKNSGKLKRVIFG
jgi:membrane-associated phospholipid phosphatase